MVFEIPQAIGASHAQCDSNTWQRPDFAKDHTLILIDFQSQMAFATHSIDAATLRTNAALAAHAAAGLRSVAIVRIGRG